ncbi:hypothetical protein [Pseudolysinimonas yzui]|uniref:Transmembrane protein n=1 Tax=Pseudolysinimonas yzui TaxID=2708254 RepID=A0A8J3GPZ5_9MICO|nr:hypothetical protein [Pseudolysinimonas yzui]GHF13104.1 hypothetical protein GCM10011600_12380 [Pseudolysinimonas yzui]
MSPVVARLLAVVGTVLVGLPLVAPVGLAIASLFVGGFHLDFLLPGELFLVVLAGGAALLGAALVSRRRRWPIGALLAAVVVLLAATALFANATGLASGSTEAEGWPLAIVAGTYALYVAAVVTLFVTGIVLCRDLFRR